MVKVLSYRSSFLLLLFLLLFAYPPPSTAINVYTPLTTVQPFFPLHGVTVSTGGTFTCVIYYDQTGACWLNNVPNGSFLNPVPIRYNTTNLPMTLLQITTSLTSVCALTDRREVYCWGDCTRGLCGLGSLYASAFLSSPPSIPVDFGGRRIAQISSSASAEHICAITLEDSLLVCWGRNENSRMGLGSSMANIDIGNTDNYLPYPNGIVNVGSGANRLPATVSVGREHTCILTQFTYSVLCFGNNQFGQLGIASTVAQATASLATTVALGGTRTAVSLSLGAYHTCIIVNNTNDVMCWGRGNEGQLGLGSTAAVGTGVIAVSTAVVNLGATKVVSLSCGAYHTCVILTSPLGQSKCWGANSHGQLGLNLTVNENIGDNEVPSLSATIDVGGIHSRIAELSAGLNHTCAALHERILLCWGPLGSSGGGTDGWNWFPSSLYATVNGFIIGNDETPAQASAVVEIGPPYRLTLNPIVARTLDYYRTPLGNQLSTGIGHSCMIDGTNFKPICFGKNSDGQLGWGNLNVWATTSNIASTRQYAVLPNGRTALAVSANDLVTCFILDNRQIACTGRNTYCQLGTQPSASSTFIQSTPTLVPLGNNQTAVHLSVGGTHVCVVRGDRRVQCWGLNDAFQLGISVPGGTASDFICQPSLSVVVPSFGSTVADQSIENLCLGFKHTCVTRTSDKKPLCFGDNSVGQRGTTNTPGPQVVPVGPGTGGGNPIGLSVRHLSCGHYHTCAVFTTSYVVCWGQGNTGALGNINNGFTSGNTWFDEYQDVISPPSGSKNTVQVVFATRANNLAITVSGAVTNSLFSWGNNQNGEVGNNDNNASPNNIGESESPVSITVPSSYYVEASTGSGSHWLLLDDKGIVSVWGLSDFNQLGLASVTKRTSPVTLALGGGILSPTLPIGGHSYTPYVVDTRSTINSPAPNVTLTLDVIIGRPGPPHPDLGIGIASSNSATTFTACFPTWYVPNPLPVLGGDRGQLVRCNISLTSVLPFTAPEVYVSRSLTNIRPGAFSYSSQKSAISITSVSPSRVPTDGTGTLTLNGINMGTDSSRYPIVYIGKSKDDYVPCTSTSFQSSTRIVCIVPPNTGTNYLITASVGGNLYPTASLCGTGTNCTFSYFPPFIQYITPTTQLVPGTVISLVGTGYGPLPSSTLNITIGRRPCLNITHRNDNLLQCVIPTGLSVNENVTVSVGGQLSNSNLTISGQQPIVYSIYPNFSYTGTVSYTRNYQITGFNMGFNASDITSVTIGGIFCPSIVWYNSSYLECRNVPTHLEWNSTSVTVNYKGILSPPNDLFRYYPRPTIIQVLPPTGQGGSYLTIEGSALGRTPSDVKDVLIGSVSCPNWRFPSTDIIVCNAPYGLNGPQLITIVIEDGPSTTLSNGFVYLDSPTLYVSWITLNDTVTMLPSTNTFPLYLDNPLMIRISDNLNGAVLSTFNPRCYITMETAINAKDPENAKLSLFFGNTTVIPSKNSSDVALGWAAFSIGARAPSGTTFIVSVSCQIRNGDVFTAPTNLRFTLRHLLLNWTTNHVLYGHPPSLSSTDIDTFKPPHVPALQLYSYLTNPLLLTPVSVVGIIPCRMDITEGVELVGTVSTAAFANGTILFSRVGVRGPLAAYYRLTVTCTWVNGEILSILSPISYILNVSLQTVPNKALVSHLLYGTTPPDPFIYQLQSLLQDSFTTNNAINILPLSLPFLREYDFVCVLETVLFSTGAEVPVTYTYTYNPSVGRLYFTNAKFFPPESESVTLHNYRYPIPIVVTPVCTLRGQELVNSFQYRRILNITLPSVRWKQSPPSVAYPSTVQRLLPFPQNPVVELVTVLEDNVLIPIDDDNTTRCTLSVDLVSLSLSLIGSSETSYVDVPIQLYGPSAGVSVGSTNGCVMFRSVAIAAPFDSLINLQATCSRLQGGRSFATDANISFINLGIDWTEVPPTYSLYNTQYRISIQLFTYAVNQQFYYDPSVAGSATCTLLINNADNYTEPVTLLGGARETSSFINATGGASMSVRISAPAGILIQLIVRCDALGDIVTSSIQTTIMEDIRLSWLSSNVPPLYILPSSPGARMYVQPFPVLQFSTVSNNFVNYNGIVCFVYVNATVHALTRPSTYEIPTLLESPQEGYLYQSLPTNGVVLNLIQVSAAWGDTVNLYTRCQRSQGDYLPILAWNVNMKKVQPIWRKLPPTQIASKEEINFSLNLVDKLFGNLITEDSRTRCTVRAEPFALAQGSDVVAKNGIVSTLSYSLAGRAGLQYTLLLSCSLGERLYPDTLNATIEMTGCQSGFSPVGDNTTCALCGNGYYSDGGTMNCVKCPSSGIECAGGIPNLLPNFFLASSRYRPAKVNEIAYITTITINNDITSSVNGSVSSTNSTTYIPPTIFDIVTYLPENSLITDPVTITPTLEFHECLSDKACLVYPSNRTYGCAPGYSGPLCGVCRHDLRYARSGKDCVECYRQGVNIFLLFLAFILITAILIYIALYMKFTEDSQSRVVWRILVNYLTALAALGVYAARGTETFRAIFNFMVAISAPGNGVTLELSPLACEFGLGYYSRYYTMMALPLVVAFLCVVINIVWIFKTYYSQGRSTIIAQVILFFSSRKWLSVVMVVLSLAYPSLTSNAFSIFSCLPYSIGGIKYLSTDIGVQCNDVQYKLAVSLAYVAIILLVLGFPLCFGIWLKYNEHRVKLGASDSSFFTQFGFLYAGYRTDTWPHYCYESLVMLRKAMIVLLGSVLTDAYLQVMAAQVIVVLALSTHLIIMPYAAKQLNYLEAATLFCLSATQAISLAYLRSSTLQTDLSSTLAKDNSSGSSSTTGSGNSGSSSNDASVTTDGGGGDGSVRASARTVLPNGLINDIGTTALLVLLNGTMVIAIVVFYVRAIRNDNERRRLEGLQATGITAKLKYLTSRFQKLTNSSAALTNAMNKNVDILIINPLANNGTENQRTYSESHLNVHPLTNYHTHASLLARKKGHASVRNIPGITKPSVPVGNIATATTITIPNRMITNTTSSDSNSTIVNGTTNAMVNSSTKSKMEFNPVPVNTNTTTTDNNTKNSYSTNDDDGYANEGNMKDNTDDNNPDTEEYNNDEDVDETDHVQDGHSEEEEEEEAEPEPDNDSEDNDGWKNTDDEGDDDTW